MRFIVLLTSIMLASLGMASDADQRDEREDILIAMQQSSDVAQWVIDTWKNYRASYVPRFAALGAEAKTVSEWSEQWTRGGQSRAHYPLPDRQGTMIQVCGIFPLAKQMPTRWLSWAWGTYVSDT